MKLELRISAWVIEALILILARVTVRPELIVRGEKLLREIEAEAKKDETYDLL